MFTPWAIQVLTMDYLIAGQIDGSDILQQAIFSLPGRHLDSRTAVTLTSVQIQPTGSLPVPGGSISSWTLGVPLGVIGVIPRDEKSMAEVLRNKNEKETVPVGMLIGPYVIRGTLYVNPKYVLRATGENGLTLKNVEIDRITPDSILKGLKAPAMVVSTHLLQGMWPG
jgi:hypothetical protein